MNRFTKPEFSKRIFSSFTLSIVIFVVVLCLFLVGISKISSSSVTNDKELLQEALQRDIIHCYCVEGMYPPNVAYMEKHYGLSYDKNKYIIDYEFVGSNIKPGVMIIEK